MKRVAALLLAAAILVGMLPMRASAAQGSKLAAITFDDGPSYRQTPRLLDGLKARGAKATFFVLGQNAQDNLDVIQRAYEEGHEIASHTWDHEDLTGLSDSGVQNEIRSTERVLNKVCGEGKYLLRPPYGSANARVRALAGVPLVYWSVDPEDWRYRDADTVCANIVNNTTDGAIILVHDIYASSVDGALRAIDKLKEKGYEFVTVTELHRRRQVAMENGQWHDRCSPKGNDLGPLAKPEITYTADGKNMTVTLTVSGNHPIYYTTDGRHDRCSPKGNDLGPLAKPEITYTADGKNMTVTLTVSGNHPIYYTTDGSVPGANSRRYTGPFTVAYGSTIKAFAAYDLNGGRSDMAVLAKGQAGEFPAPKIRLNGGKIEIQSASNDGTTYYTTDGAAPSPNSTVYTAPFAVERGRTIRAITAGGYYTTSKESSVFYTHRGNLFADVTPGSWYYEAMDLLAEAGLLSGMGGNRYAPNTPLTRGMLVTILYAYEGKTLGGAWDKTNPFTDVPSDAWYAEAVEWAYRNGVTAGYTATTFAPDRRLTRQELSVMIDGFLKYRGNPLPRGNSCAGKFGDYSRISSWALPSIEAMVQAGMLAGDGKNVNPQNGATRAEVSVIVRRVMEFAQNGATRAEVSVIVRRVMEFEASPERMLPAEEPTTEPATTPVPETTVPETTVPETTVPEMTETAPTEPTQTTESAEETTSPTESTAEQPQESVSPTESGDQA